MAITADTIREHIEALNRGDIDAVSSIIADDFVQDWPQSGERVRGKQACLAVLRNYPGGPPTMKAGRVTGLGDTWVAEVELDYSGQKWFGVSFLTFRADKLVHEVDYFAEPFPAPEWRIQWVERVEPAIPA